MTSTNGVPGDIHRPRSVGVKAGRTLIVLCLASAWFGLVVSPNAWWHSYALAQTSTDDHVRPDVNEPIVDIRIEGNVTIPASAILKYLKTQPGRPASPQQVRADVTSLYKTRWFFAVEPRYRRTEQGLILIIKVNERPIVQRVEYRGNKKIKTKHLVAITGLKRGSPFDVSANRESARRLEAHYHDKGYPFATVELLKGGEKDDREVIFSINESQKTAVRWVTFTGNKFFSSALLKTKLRTKRAFLWYFGGGYDPTTVPDDIVSLKQYYHSLGFFDVEIESKVRFSKNRRWASIEYFITEGLRFKVRNIELDGNQIFRDEDFFKDMKLKENDFFSARHLTQDVTGMKDKYGRLGRLFARVDAVPRFLEEPGIVDIVYKIDEDRVYRIRRINVHIAGDNPHTKETVIHNRLRVQSGDLADPKEIRRSERRLRGQLFESGPANGPRITISRVPDEKTPQPRHVFRGQNFDGPFEAPDNPLYDSSGQAGPFGNALQTPLPPGWVDANVYATEARTGRLMFGVGVNSDAGVVGSVVLSEENFDIFRPPGSFQDFLNGTAWRGGGQRLRIEAIPGNIVSRYLFSWTDPYFLDTDYSLSVSGFYYNRFFPDWNEQRTGGRVSLGKQLTHEISINGAFRFEEVVIDDPDIPTPALLTESLGSNLLTTFRASVAHDTRDSAFLPGDGHFAQASYEQAVGDFIYPRFEAEARQYFTVHQRPDGGGRHIVTLAGQFGWTDVDTPIFERFFAGGFQTFRGFEYRGVSPRQFGVRIGGRWMLLGTAEYKIPLTADDNISAVVFTDVGTVENDSDFNEFRATAGVGLRLTIPAMGPVPLAFDFAIPITRQDTDETRIFSFYIGINN